MLEALSLKINAETRYRCQVSVYRTIGPLVVLVVVVEFVVFAIILVFVAGCTLVVVAPEGALDDSVVVISIIQRATSKERYSFELPVIPVFSSLLVCFGPCQ